MKPKLKINSLITNKNILLIRETGNKECLLDEALLIAQSQKLDLIEFSCKDNISICKIGNYKKILFDNSKLQKGGVSHKIKEIRIGLFTEKGDYDTKVAKIRSLIKKQSWVKITVLIKNSRQIKFKESKLDYIVKNLQEDFPKSLLEINKSINQKNIAAVIIIKNK